MSNLKIKQMGWQWAPVPAGVITSPTLDSQAVRVYSNLLLRSNSAGVAWPGISGVAGECHMSSGAVRKARSGSEAEQ